MMMLVACPAAAQIYQWTDAAGVEHYTTDPARIPEAFRARVRELDSARSDAAPADTRGIPLDSATPILARALLNGVALTLLVDTGADRTVITPAVLARAGVEATGGRPVAIVGVAGSAQAREVVIQQLEVAGARLGPIAVIAHELPGSGADGLLGRDLLGYFTLTLERGTLTLAPR
ncbi:MAG: aspartyl protease family protein [Candidatus Rokubacteria bacterium]|nr:aspartyl protease family protein [Candidatus Rokubacteria bacterium]